MFRFLGSFTSIVSIGLSVALISSAFAQISTTPTPAQIEQFKRLPAAQQKALAKQFGVDLGSLKLKKQLVHEPEQEAPENQYIAPAEYRSGFEDTEKEDELKPFGYDMFEQYQGAFIPSGIVPVPSDYVIGPGDSLKINFFGKETQEYELTIDNDGYLFIPQLSPILVSGLTYQELKHFISNKVSEQIIGTQVAVSIADLRSIQVYVVGNAKKPGAYNLSSLSTLTNALFVSGGPSSSGSLRNIKLKRGGKTIANFDLYDLFINGEVSQDVRLQQGDTLFLGSIEGQVTVAGEVRRPAIYEVTENETVNDLISMAGGLTGKAYPKRVLLATLDENYQRDLKRVDLTKSNEGKRVLRKGDVLTVMPISERLDAVVNVAGAVSRPSTYAWYEGITLAELITSQDDLMNTTDMNYALILSESADGSFSVKQFKPSQLFTREQTQLSANDLVIFFNRFDQSTFEIVEDDIEKELDIKPIENDIEPMYALEQEQTEVALNYLHAIQNGDLFEKQEALAATKTLTRKELVEPITQLLSSSSIAGVLVQTVEVTGQVKFPGVYPISNGAKLSDIILASGGLTESANLKKGEISRIEEIGTSKSIKHIEFDMMSALSGHSNHNYTLQARDVINVFQQANWQDELKVTIEGEVLYPGEYTIKEGETLTQVLQRAGGLTKFAAPEGAFFTRKALKELEEKQAKNMARSLSKELAFKSISSSYANINVGEVQELVNKLTTVEGVGRLVIDLPMLLANQNSDVKLENGDAILIPAFRNEVNVIGEVQVATSHLHQDKWKLKQYLKSSGGLRLQADDERIYVIRANGLVDAPSSSWFGSENLDINPGDTIVVPLDSGYTDRLTLWEKATSIFYQLTVGLAALGRL